MLRILPFLAVVVQKLKFLNNSIICRSAPGIWPLRAAPALPGFLTGSVSGSWRRSLRRYDLDAGDVVGAVAGEGEEVQDQAGRFFTRKSLEKSCLFFALSSLLFALCYFLFAIESLHCRLRKMTRNRSVPVNDGAIYTIIKNRELKNMEKNA
jgi:hypothetical protein